MAKYRPIDVRIWNDRKFLSLSQDSRMLWLFLLTSPSTLAIPGVIVAGEASIAEQLGWDVKRLRERFAELFQRGLSIKVEGRLVWLCNATKYQPPANPNMVIGWAKCWDDVPEGNLKHELWQSLKIACKSWSRTFDKQFPEPFRHGSENGIGNGFTQEQKQDQEQEQKQDQGDSDTPSAVGFQFGFSGSKPARTGKRKPKPSDPSEAEAASVRVVLDKLTAQNGVRYSGTAEHTRLITNQLRAGVTEHDLRIVIGYCALELEWKGDPAMEKFLRPETLFGPKTIAKYLDPARTWFAKLPPDEPTHHSDPEEEPDWMRGGDA